MEDLDSNVLQVVQEDLGFKSWTPVQQAVIPTFLQHRDVAVEACTGSGKTLAYLVPVFEMVLRRLKAEVQEDLKEDEQVTEKRIEKEIKRKRKRPGHWHAVIISPTRELAHQIFKVADPFAKRTGLGTMLLTGGTSVLEDVERVSREPVEIVIGTPGRMDDVMGRASRALSYRYFEALILDEADVLLDMGFERTISSILSRLPKQRRTGLFSATQTKEVKALIRAGLRNPAVISVQVQHEASNDDGKDGSSATSSSHKPSGSSQQKTPTTLENFWLVCEQDEKLQRLCSFLCEQKKEKLIVFFSTCASVAFFMKALPFVLNKHGISIFALHGKMAQKKRNKMYSEFVDSDKGVLLCTDVAARGIDIPDVDWIVQFDPPQDPSFFVHRVGRTARAGRKGRALVFLLPKETSYLNLLDNRKVPMVEYPGSEALASKTDHKDVLTLIRAAVLKDRELLEHGTKAFVAFVRSYKEHKCQFIFRLKDLDMAKVARSFVLLRVPNLSELRESKGIKGFQEEPLDVVNAIPYADKGREKQRQKRYVEQKEKIEEERAAKREEKKRKLREQKQKAEQPKRRKHSRQKAIYEEWDQLAKEEREFKKFKKGKISEEDYNDFFFSTNN